MNMESPKLDFITNPQSDTQIEIKPDLSTWQHAAKWKRAAEKWEGKR